LTAFIVQWIGSYFFFSFELSYLRVPEKPHLAGELEGDNRLSLGRMASTRS
jgi:hypothetical protein